MLNIMGTLKFTTSSEQGEQEYWYFISYLHHSKFLELILSSCFDTQYISSYVILLYYKTKKTPMVV